MPKNVNLPKIYQARQRVVHTCLKSCPYLPKMRYACLMHQVYVLPTRRNPDSCAFPRQRLDDPVL